MGSYVVVNSRKKLNLKRIPGASFAPGIPVFRTQEAGQAVEIIREICRKDHDAVIHVLGGDGSVLEAANAILSSGYSDTAALVVHPFGTGNDFSRNFTVDGRDALKRGEFHRIDLIRFGQRYAANEINLGFDCDVVVKTGKIKRFPLFRGSIAYMISVLLTLFRPLGRMFDFTLTDEAGEKSRIQGKFLLCLAANGGYYGGGFRSSPRARLDDGLLEFLWVEKISRLKFLTFFLGYRKGKHLNPDGTVRDKYASFLHYKRIQSVSFRSAGELCADGEIYTEKDLTVEAVPGVLSVCVEEKIV